MWTLNEKIKPIISFNYGEVPFHELIKSAKAQQLSIEKEDYTEHELIYSLEDGLKVTNKIKEFKKFNACEWVTYYENIGEKDTKIISELYDCDAEFAFEYDKKPDSKALIPQFNTTKIFNPKGSTWEHDEFCTNEEEVMPGGIKANYIFPGDEKIYMTNGGRSSQAKAPFFDINRMDAGVILAIGWSGQWNCRIKRNDTHINIKTGIEGVRFKLYPNEKIRTSSIVIMPYDNGRINAHNQWRSLIKDQFSLIGRPGRPQYGPFCHGFWGATSSDKLIDRIDKIAKSGLGYEYMWIDAGWYGDSKIPCPNEFEGDWWGHTGNWEINPTYHPDKLKDVVSIIKDNHMKFILWFEPERVMNSTPIAREHPEYFLKTNLDNEYLLLNLGNENAWQYCLKTLCEKIDTLGIDCYRQDFNFDPLNWWRENDREDRQGINEIRHITGMYRLWDTLLEKYPNLIIDNCASGGRRIDIETLRRSIPLWRSDYYCPANFDVETTQTHTLGFNLWVPYSGTGTGRVINDTYRLRSSYASSMVSNYWYAEAEYFEMYDADTLNWIRKTNMEYLKVREYFTCDFYPLTEISYDKGSWCAWQFDRPEKNDGIVMIFKRPESNGIAYQFNLGGISRNAVYKFTDADTNESSDISGEELSVKGFHLTIHEKRTAKLYFYTKREI